MPSLPRVSSLLSSPASIVWSNGVSFDGYVVLTLSLPTGYTGHALKNSLQPLIIPQKTKVPVTAGVIDTATRLFYNADVNPPGTQYTGAVYDIFGVLVASFAAPFSVTTDQTTLTIPTLTVPS